MFEQKWFANDKTYYLCKAISNRHHMVDTARRHRGAAPLLAKYYSWANACSLSFIYYYFFVSFRISDNKPQVFAQKKHQEPSFLRWIWMFYLFFSTEYWKWRKIKRRILYHTLTVNYIEFFFQKTYIFGNKISTVLLIFSY